MIKFADWGNTMRRPKNTDDSKDLSKSDLIARYNEIVNLIPKVQTPPSQVTNLKQPSLLEKVDSITTYCISSSLGEKNA